MSPRTCREGVSFTLASMVRLSRALHADPHVRLAGGSRRQATHAIGKATRAPMTQASRLSKPMAKAGTPAALHTRHSAAGKPRQPAAARARTR
jgi:hypothetical protein